MQVNTSIYGAPGRWSAAQYLTFAKYANFNTTAAPENTLLQGSARGKTPTGELIENSICTQALGSESLYSNMLWVHDYGSTQYIKDERGYTPFFFAECVSTDNNVQNNEGHINPIYNYNSWSPYTTDNVFQNKSAYSKPITEYQPKKIIYRIFMTVCDANGNVRSDPILLDRADLPAEQAALAEYPYIANAYMRVYVDSSNTDTPQRAVINSNSLFGVCPNVSFNADTTDININYAFFRSMLYNHIPIYGCFGINYFDDHYTGCLCDTADIVIDSNSVSARHLWDNDFKEYLIRQAACFGGFVYISNSTGVSILEISLDSNDIILGLLDEYGIGHGEYTRGAANRDNPIWSWSTNRDSPYDPYKEPPSDYDDSSHFNSITLASCNKVWVASYNEVEDLVAELYKGLSAKPIDVYTTDYSVDTYLSTNAIDGILSVRHYPLIRVPCSDTVYPLTIGAYTSNDVSVRKFVNAAGSQFIDFKFSRNKRLNEAFDGSFLDREPYTTAELYIPFCGTVPISIADYIGHDITVKLAIDYKTGSCTAYILKDSTPLQSANGQIGVDIPVSGLQSATLDGQLLNANLALKQSQTSIITGGVGAFTSAVGGVASVVGGGKFGLSQTAGSAGGIVSQIGAVSNAIDRKDVLAYELHHQETPVKTISAGSPTTAAMGELCCRLTIYRPILSADYDPEVYAKTIGFACLINGKVRDFSGLTLGIISLDGINATAEEKQLIATAFKQGVFL